MNIERLGFEDIRFAAIATRLMLSSGDGRRVLGELFGADETALARMDGRLRQWLETSHLEIEVGLN